MSNFDSLASEKEYLQLNSKRSAALVCLTNLKKSLEALPRDKPSLDAFERITARIDGRVEQLEIATEAVSAYFSKMGGDPLNDSTVGYWTKSILQV